MYAGGNNLHVCWFHKNAQDLWRFFAVFTRLLWHHEPRKSAVEMWIPQGHFLRVNQNIWFTNVYDEKSHL